MRELVSQEKTMKTDAYTKFILTVVAACLIVLCLKDVVVVRPVKAAEAQQKPDQHPEAIDVTPFT